MTDFFIYNLQVGFALAVLYLFFTLFLRKQTFFGLNRTYLLGVLVISFVLPAFPFSSDTFPSVIHNQFTDIGHTFYEAGQTMDYMAHETAKSAHSFSIIWFLMTLGMFLSSLRIGFQLFGIYKDIRNYGIETHGKYKYVLMNKCQSAHTFFNFIFICKSDFSPKINREVLLHEQVHANKLHSFDLLIVGLLTILQWFNPFMYLFKRALAETHEFEADQLVMDSGVDKLRYQRLLLSQTRSVLFAGLTNKFNQSLMKSRLKMMNKVRSKNSTSIRYLLVIPIVFMLSIVFATSQENLDVTFGDAFAHDSGKIMFQANELIHQPNGTTVLNGDVTLKTNGMTLRSERIIIDRNEKMIYTPLDENVPSIYPVDKKQIKRMTSGFGMRMHPILKEKRMHNGLDFAASTGTPVMATADGKVRSVESDNNRGNWVVVDHENGYSTGYSQLSEYIVKKGQKVKQGEVIGYVGSTGMSTGPHLHYEVMKDGKYVDPGDYLGESRE